MRRNEGKLLEHLLVCRMASDRWMERWRHRRGIFRSRTVPDESVRYCGLERSQGRSRSVLEMAGNMNVRMKQTRMTGTTCNSFLFFNVCNLSSWCIVTSSTDHCSGSALTRVLRRGPLWISARLSDCCHNFEVSVGLVWWMLALSKATTC
jgi:hypothetical protein